MSTSDKTPIEIEETLREYIQNELRGVYTMSMVVVESVNADNHTCTVSLKYSEQRVLEGVPIASPYVGDEAGMVVPVSADDEGFVLHNKKPLAAGFARRGNVEQSSERLFSSEDVIFFPAVWNGTITVPDHDKGDFLVSHESGTIMRLKSDGSFVVEHGGGNVIEMDANGRVTLGNKQSSAALLNENAKITDSSGGQCSIDDPGTTDVSGG